MKSAKPFIKWAGGKRKLAKTISQFIPEKFNTYYEPFLGAGAMLFFLKPEKAVVNDINRDLIDTYICIRDNTSELISALEKHCANDSRDYYYDIRNMDRSECYNSMIAYEKSARLIYLNKSCYNGLYRVNKKGYFNVPYGRHDSLNFCISNIEKVSIYLNSAEITFLSGDFHDAVSDAGKGDFVYFDPPYFTDKSQFTQYHSDCFGVEEHKRLKRSFDGIVKKGGFCIQSNSAYPFIEELYFSYDIHRIDVNRAINSDPLKRGKVQELIIAGKTI